MKRAEWELIMHEYRTTREQTAHWFHVKWENMINEYSLDGFDGIVDMVMKYSAMDNGLTTHDATVGKLHVVIRKMLTLSAIRYPEFSIKERNPKDEPVAQVLNDIFPSELERVDWYEKMRTRNLWALLTGFGVMKLGVNSVYHYDDPAYASRLPQKLEDRDTWNLYQYGPLTEWQDPSILPGEANLVHIPSTNCFSHPWNAPTQEHVFRWFIRFQRPLLDIYRDARFGPERINVLHLQEDSDIERDPYFNTLPMDAKIHSLRGEVVWVYDVCSRKYCIVAEGAQGALMDWTPVNRNINPLHVFTPIASVRSWRGIPYSARMFNQAQAINELRVIIKDKIARDGKMTFLFDPAEMTDEQVTRLNRAQDGEWIKFPGLSTLMRDGKEFMKAIEYGKPTPEILQLMSMYDGDFREMAGLDNPAMNVPNKRSQTATESNIRAQQTNLDVADYVQTNEESQKKVARDYLKLVCAEWPVEKTVKVRGFNEESYFWLPVTRNLVQSDFNLEIVVGSTQKLDRAMFNQQWTEVMPRIMELGAKKQANLMAQLQGMPTDGLNYDEMIRVTCDLFDPTIARKILQKRDPLMLIYRYMEQYGILPTQISPDIVRELQRRIMVGLSNPFGQQTPLQAEGSAGAGSTASFEETNGVPKPAGGQMGPNQMPIQQMGGFQSGRMASETAVAGV